MRPNDLELEILRLIYLYLKHKLESTSVVLKCKHMKGKIILLALSALAISGCKKKVNPTPEPTAREIALEDYNTNYLGSAVSDPEGAIPGPPPDRVLCRHAAPRLAPDWWVRNTSKRPSVWAWCACILLWS